MPEPTLISRQRELLRHLARLAADRARGEPALEQGLKARRGGADTDYADAYQSVIVRFAADKEAADIEVRETREAIDRQYTVEALAADHEYEDSRNRITTRYEREKADLKSQFNEARWTIDAVYEGSKTAAEDQLREDEKRVAARVQRLQEIRDEAERLLRDWKIAAPEEVSAEIALDPAAPPTFRKLPECVAIAEDKLDHLRRLSIPPMFKGQRFLLFTLLLWLALIVPFGWAGAAVFAPEATLYGRLLLGLAGSTLLGLALGFTLNAVLFAVGRRQALRLYRPLVKAQREALASRHYILETFQARCRQQVTAAKEQHDRDLRVKYQQYRRDRAALKDRRHQAMRQVKQRYRERRAEVDATRDREATAAEERHQRRLVDIQQRFEQDSEALHRDHERQTQEIKSWYEQEWRQMAGAWQHGLEQVTATAREIQEACGKLFPPVTAQAPFAAAPPPVLRFGSFRVGLDLIPDGVPGNEKLKLGRIDDFTLPALGAFPDRGSLLFEFADAGQAETVRVMQAVMFRLLTALPPGKVRFTILDPVGLGQNFAAFMHLADYDELLVTSRIWTEAAHVEQRLADLTGHMENVIQKYLRNQYDSITAYNEQAGEVAEPFRVLVAANFPVNFSADAARRLLSIVQSGPRCGVLALIGADVRQPLPQGFNLSDLEQHCLNLVWQGGRFVWRDPDFSRFPLQVDEPPRDDVGHELLHRLGAAARDANRVEVPFEFIAPPPERWWTGDSRLGIKVPLGRAGATKRQHLELGKGTAQHVLVVGKTGSGKSTLLHALITNLALLYNPDEVELYLIDFKKGVEFKTYAANELPHARVVAIESEREFGVSVLQRLDAELKTRGDRFRAVGAQDVNAYRTAHPDAVLPRILLIVDEFQEFFTEDDRLAQDAAQLLDRLVRQGRAFGLHVLLGSQTLGGAYSLARSTIDQMAVRIALQCSEADAQLVLSDDNSAARLLSRPGEAIYNDANGLVEGNDPFQVVWLPEERREYYLHQIRDQLQRSAERGARSAERGARSAERGARSAERSGRVVFEGNVPADVRRNPLLDEALRNGELRAPRSALRAWLGESLSLKDPTSAAFRRQSGSNLMMVGQQDEAALGMLTVTAVGLAAQVRGRSDDRPFLYVIDGSAVDAPYAGYLPRLAGVLPDGVRLGGYRDVPHLMTELTAELARRQQTPDEEQPPVFLLIFALQRFRDLRRAEDDFGFGRAGDAPVTPAQQFTTLLREGSALGMHTLLWCDTLNNLQRTLDRQSLREFEMRVVFQMSVADSSNLIDTPLAGKLGANRALFHSEEEGRLEKFRPYGVPPEEWLEFVRQQFRGVANR